MNDEQRTNFLRLITIVITRFDDGTLQITCSRATWAGAWLIDIDKLTDGKTLKNVLDCACNDFLYFGSPKIREEEDNS